MIKTLVNFIFILFLLSVVSCKKNRSNVTSQEKDFDSHYSINAKYDNNTSLLTVHVQLDGSIHAYAEGEKIGRPVNLELIEKNGWKPLGPKNIPAGKTMKINGLESTVLTESFEISQKVKKGQNEGEALLYLQVCKKNLCDRPRTHKLTF
jgi:hypothetical protein